ncbi:hypothetical protein J2I47_08090 [Fibrella sp. HMF5335]|uniref:Sulfite dehydrogenase (Cytochrome) subunit SorB n=1 Tax=Fibrella rubiginis TaxID=2817060 RepID=A0A939GHD7_9BACT|nr:hypothetical protein [Fibrella rubiginis]MBO0936498.1 hypothetical protein [Fibrella rubiginis]
MKSNSNNAHHWLLGSLCVWLLCAGVAQQPAPPKKTVVKAHSATSARKVAKQKPVMATPASTTMVNADGVPVDSESGLALDKNRMLVQGQCTACHSSKLILQSHFDREKWVERIRWMQRTQKLWDLGESEPAVLTYLTKYYGPIKTPFDGRRLPLDAPKWYKEAGG